MVISPSPSLIIFSGLSGTGKTTLAKVLTRRLGAVHIRIDSIEQAITNAFLNIQDMEDVGYQVGYAIAEDNLRLGRTVIADSVNPIALTRKAWSGVAERAGCQAIEVEVVCSDSAEHRQRIEERISDIPGLIMPNWQAVLDREYEPMIGDHNIIDTAGKTPEQCLEVLLTHAIFTATGQL